MLSLTGQIKLVRLWRSCDARTFTIDRVIAERHVLPNQK